MLLAFFRVFFALGRVASWGAECRPCGRHETCQNAARGTSQLGPCGKVCTSRGGRGDGCARWVCCSPSFNLLQRRSSRTPGPGLPVLSEVPASFADNSFVRGSLRPPPLGCGRAADPAVAGAAGAGTLWVRGHSVSCGGCPRGGLGGACWGEASALAWVLHMARRAVWCGHAGRVTFLPALDLQSRGSRLPAWGFS